MLAAAPSIRALVSAGHSDETLTNYLDRVATAYSYAGIMIFDIRGRVLARSSGSADPHFDSGAVAVSVTRTRAPRMALSDEKSGRRFLTVAIPVFADPAVSTSNLLAVIALRVQQEPGMYT